MQTFVASYAAGAVGAVVSVLSRMGATPGPGRGQGFTIDFEVGRKSVRRLGALRPLTGAVFALALYFALQSNLLSIPIPKSPSQVYFYLVVGFLAGFSERVTKVLLTTTAEKVLPGSGETSGAGAPAPDDPRSTRDDGGAGHDCRPRSTCRPCWRCRSSSWTTCSRASPAGPIPRGECDGTVIAAPGTEFAEIAAKVAHFLAWKGKVFDPERGELQNRITPFDLHAVAAKVYLADSWFDQKECIVLDYSETSLVAHWIRDEIREVADGLYLGLVFWEHTRILYFSLRTEA